METANEHPPRWTPALQDAADDLRASALRASQVYDLSYNDVIVVLAMVSATLVPKPADDSPSRPVGGGGGIGC